MKHTWALSLLGASIIFLLTSMNTSAQEAVPTDLKVEITTSDDLRVQLTAQNETGKKLYLSVLMLENSAFHRVAETEVYSEEVSGDISNFSRVLNLSKLESGSYRIKIKAGKQHFERLLSIRTKPVLDDSRFISLK
jgi:hypothetical protein